MPNKVKVENLYRTIVTSSTPVPVSGDFTFDVAVAPKNKNGFLILGSENISTRQIFYYHDVVGNTIHVRGTNRITSAAIPIPTGYSVKMNDVAEIFNYFGDNISTLFYVEKMGGVIVKAWGGYLMYNNNQVGVSDTTITLVDNTTNYIKYDAPTNTVFADTIAAGNIKCEVVCASGEVTTINYRVSKESYLDFSISIEGALPSQVGNAGKVLITNGNTVSWGVSNAKRTGLVPSAVLITDPSGNEVESTTLPDAVMSSIATSPIIMNTVGNAGKYIQTVALGEAVSSATPVAMAVVGNIKYNQTFTTNAGANQVRIGWRVIVPYSGYTFGIWKTWANASSSSAAVLILDASGNTLKSVSMAVGTNSVDLAYSTTTANTEYRIVLNDTANWTGGSTYQYTSLANTQATFPYIVGSIYGAGAGTLLNTDGEIFTEANINFGLKAYKARANRATEPQFANFAGFVTGTKSIGDSVDLNANDGVLISGFTGITSSNTYYLGDSLGTISQATGSGCNVRIGNMATSTSIIISKKQLEKVSKSYNTPGMGGSSFPSQGVSTFVIPVEGNTTMQLGMIYTGSGGSFANSLVSLAFSLDGTTPQRYIIPSNTTAGGGGTTYVLNDTYELPKGFLICTAQMVSSGSYGGGYAGITITI